MGILSNLFKSNNQRSKIEGRGGQRSAAISFPFASTPESENKAEKAEALPAAESETETNTGRTGPSRTMSLGGSRKSAFPSQESPTLKKNIPHTAFSEVKKIRKVLSSRASTIPDKQIVVDFDDVLSQISAEHLIAGRNTVAKKELRFNVYELLPSLTLGKAVVPLARIAELLPDQVSDKNLPAGEEIKLPLAKIVAQIGTFPARPDQIEEQFPPLDPQYAKLIVEQGVPIEEIINQPAVPPIVEQAPAPVEATKPAPALPAEKSAVAAATEMPAAPIAEVEEPAVEEPEIEEPEPFLVLPASDEKVSYSLAALSSVIPKAWIKGDLNTIGDTARVTVPFHLIDSQLAAGQVELGYEDFANGLPDECKNLFSGESDEAKAARLPVPLNEVFQNLPGVEPMPPLPKPTPAKPEPASEELVQEPVATKEPEVAGPAASAEAKVAAPDPVKEAVAAETATAEVQQIAPQPEPETKPTEPSPEAAAKVEEPAKPVEAPQEPVQQPQAPAVEPVEAKVETPAAAALQVEESPKAETGKEEPAQPAVSAPEATEEPAKVETPAPEEITMLPEPVAVEKPRVTVTLPQIQFQPLTPPPVFVKPPAAVVTELKPNPEPQPENVVEFEPNKIVAFDGSIAAFTPSGVENLFTTDGKPDAEKITGYVSRLPGVQAVILGVGDEIKTEGEIPQGFNTDQTRNAASALLQALEKPEPTPGASPLNVTLHHEGFSSTWFKQGSVQMGVIHPKRALEENVHGKLMLVAGEVATLRKE